MVSVLIAAKDKIELKRVERCTKKIAAKLSEEMWEYYQFTEIRALKRFVLEEPILQIVCIDVGMSGGISAAADIRSLGTKTLILLIADSQISPVEYMKPEVRADSLLLRPYTEKQLEKKIQEVFEYSLKIWVKEQAESEFFYIHNKDGWQLIPYDNIYCFECLGRKIVLNTARDKLMFYQTMNQIERQLPTGFVRCHQSYIVNERKIEMIQLSQHQIVLKNGFLVPISRSYRIRLGKKQRYLGKSKGDYYGGFSSNIENSGDGIRIFDAVE